MGLDKRLKKRIQQIDKNLDAIVKNPYEKVVTEPVSEPRPAWARWVFPLGGAFLSCCLALSIVLPLALTNKGIAPQERDGNSAAADKSHGSEKGAPTSRDRGPMMGGGPNHYESYEEGVYTHENLNCLVSPTRQTTKAEIEDSMSETTYDSYKAFTKKFVTLVMNANNSIDEKSMAVSIPDAYLCLAITGIISDQNCLQDVLNYLELDNMQALKNAARQIASSLGTMTKDQFGNDVGGLNLNSIWLNPEKASLLEEKDEALYEDLRDVFDASLYLEGLTSNRAKQYIAENGLPGKPLPDIKLSSDNDPAALSVMSTYYNIDVFGVDQTYYQNQFENGGHTMNYTVNGQTKKIDFINRTTKYSCMYENDDFLGATMNMSNSNISFFLPKSRTAMPSTILEDVLDEDYSPKVFTYTEGGQQINTAAYDVNISAPYFFIDNKLLLEQGDLSPSFPHLTSAGAGSRLAENKLNQPMSLSRIEQFSVMRFDFNGFYSCSATTATVEGAAQPGIAAELVLDHPYVFSTSKNVSVGYNTRSVPTVIGEIVDPNYLI